VRIFVAIQAGLESRIVVSVDNSHRMNLGVQNRHGMNLGPQTSPRVALRAGHTLMFPNQWIRCGPMAGFSKSRRFPSRFLVTRTALASIGAPLELAVVRVLVAVHAFFVGDRLFEVGRLVAHLTGQLGVLAVQWEFGLAVVEVVLRNLHALPRIGVVAGFAASSLEGSVVRILMATGTSRKVEPSVLDDLRIGGGGLMAFRAFDRLMLSGEGESGVGMIEGLDRLPAENVMAFLAVGAELAGVWIFVARQAGRVHSFEGPVEIANHDPFVVGHRDVFGIVTRSALQTGVAPFQDVSCLAVVKLIFGSVPLEDAEVLAVVLGMASRAIVVAFGTVNHASMHAFVRSHQRQNLAVAIHALELFPPRAERMTAGALERSIQRVMGSRERAGRNLRPQRSAAEKPGTEQHQETPDWESQAPWICKSAAKAESHRRISMNGHRVPAAEWRSPSKSAVAPHL